MTNPAADDFMRRAIQLAYEGVRGGHGGPFGAVIVKDGQVVGEGHNRVLSANDPTAHAEITAIRAASANLASFDLSGTEIYVNGMPCPMCMAAIFWARIGRVYYACDAADAESIGFDDAEFYRQLEKPPAQRRVPALQMNTHVEAARACFRAWAELETRIRY
ncbi:nucleoside deaminase [Acidocella sp.]|uniref:nucleoside deaminase n=1 Tax=Acidocella sp. TaxID=50710 RepID=UPI002638B8B6|nr:nucleoside deaminase [Acidocella sp.]